MKGTYIRTVDPETLSGYSSQKMKDLKQSGSYGASGVDAEGSLRKGRVDKWTVENKQIAFSYPAASTFRASIRFSVSDATQTCTKMNNNDSLNDITVKQHVYSQVSVCFPDEGALVRAAQNLGFVFSGRTPDSVIVELVRRVGQTELEHTQM